MLMHDRLVLKGIVTNISSDGIWLCCAMRSLCILEMFVLVVCPKVFLFFLYSICINFLHQRVLQLFSTIIFSGSIRGVVKLVKILRMGQENS